MDEANHSETSHLLAKSCPNYITYHSEDDSSSESDRYQNRSLNPSIGRRPSHPQRARSNSIAIFHEDEDDVIFTSYGPIVVEEETRERRRGLFGWFLAILSGVLFTSNNFFVKYYDIDALEMLLVRSALQTILMAIIIVVSKRKFLPEKKQDKVLTIVQGGIGAARIMFQFACVRYMPIGDALTIVFTEPLWTLVLSKLILKIRIGLWKIGWGFALLLGMVLCIQPPFLFPSNSSSEDDEDGKSLEDYYFGVGLAISTAVAGSMANVAIAKCEKVSSKVMVFYNGLGGVLLALMCSYYDSENSIVFSISSISLNSWLLLVLLGLSGIMGYFSMTRSLRLIPPTTVAVLRALEIILAYIAQAVVMGEIPNIISISGSSMVMFSVIAFAMEEIISRHCIQSRGTDQE